MQKLRRGADRPQCLQLGLDLGQFARIADGEVITRITEIALDAMPNNALAYFFVGSPGNLGIHCKISKPPTADQLVIGRVFMADHEA
ncbi:hypothetical protein D3C86_1966700 [compost metagenome]